MKGAFGAKGGSVLVLVTLMMLVVAMYVTTALFDVRGAIDQERIFKTKKHITYLQNAIADYRTNNRSRVLASFEELLSQGVQSSCDLTYSATFSTMQIPKNWCGPYIDVSLFQGTNTAYKEDAWGTVFQLSATSVTAGYEYTVTSCGENLVCGDADDISISF